MGWGWKEAIRNHNTQTGNIRKNRVHKHQLHPENAGAGIPRNVLRAAGSIVVMSYVITDFPKVFLNPDNRVDNPLRHRIETIRSIFTRDDLPPFASTTAVSYCVTPCTTKSERKEGTQWIFKIFFRKRDERNCL